MSAFLDCRNLVDDDVLKCNEKFTVRHRRSSEQPLKHQLLDCKRIFLISDCAESVLELACVIDDRSQDVVELLHVLCSDSF